MAAPRKYSDAQRQAMYRLFEVGKSPAEIAGLCEEGMAGASPFTIPRRTVQDIVTSMAAEAEQKLPTSVVEAESAEAVERFPARIAGILNAEIDRLEAKQQSRGLTTDDFDRVKRATDLSLTLEKRLSGRSPQGMRTRRGTRQATGSSAAPETALERLARELVERAGEDDQASRTPARRDGNDSDTEPAVTPPVTTPAAAPQPPTEATPGEDAADRTIDAALARKSPAERAETARKARAALAHSGSPAAAAQAATGGSGPSLA